MVKECVKDGSGFALDMFYKDPADRFDEGLLPLDEDADVVEMVPRTPIIEVYVQLVRPISVDNLTIRPTPTKPTPEEITVLDEEDDAHVDSEEERQRMEDRIREEEGIPKTFADIEHEKKQRRRKKKEMGGGSTSKKQRQRKGKEKAVDLAEDDPPFKNPGEDGFPEFDVDEEGSWHDDASNKDLSDNEVDFVVPPAVNQSRFYDHADDMRYDSMPRPVTEEETVKLTEKKKPRKQKKESKKDGRQKDGGKKDGKKGKKQGVDQGGRSTNEECEGEAEGGFGSSDQWNSEEERMWISSEDELDCPYPEFNEKTDMMNPKFELGMLFSGADVLRQAIRTQAIIERRPIRRTPNMGYKVQFTCKPPCEWRIYASKCQRMDSYQIKNYNRHHICQQTYHQQQISAAWIAWKYEEDIRMNIDWGIEAFQRKVINDWQCDVSDSMIYNAKRIALKVITGDHSKQYSQLWDYLNEVLRVMPGSTCKLECEEMEPGEERGKFKRLYICLALVRKGYLEGCRPIIGLDGCHLKGPFRGQLLTAVGLDGNDGMYPLAWAVVDVENTANWDWFLKLLKEDLNMQNSGSYTFISDKQKGLINALEENCPDAEQRFCVMHLYRNMYKEHKGMILRMLLWTAARSRTEYFFDKNMNQLKKLNKKCYEWLIEKPKSQWSRCGFRTTCTSDIFVNNHCESFNSAIKKFRHLPIITMLKEIHRGVMVRIQKRREKMLQKSTIFCPTALEKLIKSIEKAGSCKAEWSGGATFGVKTIAGGYELRVDIDKRECVCRKWQLSGVPCFHATKCYLSRDINPEAGIHTYLTRRKYLETYMNFVEPINGEEFWAKTPYPPPLPPDVKVAPGRQKKKRTATNDIPPDATVLKRRGTSLTCSYCKEWGHNIVSCPAKKNDLKMKGETAAPEANVVAGEVSQPPLMAGDVTAAPAGDVNQPPPMTVESQTAESQHNRGSQPPLTEPEPSSSTVAKRGRGRPKKATGAGNKSGPSAQQPLTKEHRKMLLQPSE